MNYMINLIIKCKFKHKSSSFSNFTVCHQCFRLMNEVNMAIVQLMMIAMATEFVPSVVYARVLLDPLKGKIINVMMKLTADAQMIMNAMGHVYVVDSVNV